MYVRSLGSGVPHYLIRESADRPDQHGNCTTEYRNGETFCLCTTCSSSLIASPRADESEHDRLRVRDPSKWSIESFLRPFSSAGIAAAIAPDPVDGLYTDNASAPLLQQAGLRNLYDFGLYSYCAYVNDTHGTCSSHVTAMKLQPFTDIIGDMPSNYSSITTALIPSFTFVDSQYLGEFSRGAYYLLLLGTVSTALALFVFVRSRSCWIRS